jgi:hypothetical protein
VVIYRYMPFALPDTVTDTIKLFVVLLSLKFTYPGKNNLTSDIVYMLPFYALIQWRFNLFTAHHAVCAVRLRFSNRHGYYFSYLTGSSPIWDFGIMFLSRSPLVGISSQFSATLQGIYLITTI